MGDYSLMVAPLYQWCEKLRRRNTQPDVDMWSQLTTCAPRKSTDSISGTAPHTFYQNSAPNQLSAHKLTHFIGAATAPAPLYVVNLPGNRGPLEKNSLTHTITICLPSD